MAAVTVTKTEKGKFILTDKIEEKIRGVFLEIQANSEKLRATNHAYMMIVKYLPDIDDAAKKGIPLWRLYAQISNAVGGLGISQDTFGQYIRRARKETGSLLYATRETRHSRRGNRGEKARAHAQLVVAGKAMDIYLRAITAEGLEHFNFEMLYSHKN